MRSLSDAREAWQELKQYQSLQDLKIAIRLDGDASIATAGCRSACWKVFLLFETLDTSSWSRTLSSSRSAYNSLRTHFLRYLDDHDELAASVDPLTEQTESSPWMQIRKDEELRAEILQDVVRCMPENLYFRQPETQKILVDILFIFCKLNPDLSYRQGMHEILAPILWVVERDAIDLGDSSRALGEDAVIKTMFDAEHIEHDAFALFGQVMQSAKNFYEQTTTSGKENPMVVRSRRIFSDMLPKVDYKLAEHLESIDIVPQIFLMRWIRLLFGREFAFDDVLTIWDVVFAEDATLEIVDYICVAMLLRLHWDLINAEYNIALPLLLKYPEPGKDFRPQTLTLDALYLREHMDRHCGSYLVSKYTGRPLIQAGRPVTPPALQRKVTTFAGVNAVRGTATNQLPSSPRSTRQARNFEAVLQSTAKNIYARGEKLGINKAVRNAVDEVHRKAQEIRDAQTPVTPPNWQQRRSPSMATPALIQNRVKVLEDRHKQLGQLLQSAVSELWEYQKSATTTDTVSHPNSDSTHGEKLSVAIAKVQFVQVYLEDPDLDIPKETDGGIQDQEADEPRRFTAGTEAVKDLLNNDQSPLPKQNHTENDSHSSTVASSQKAADSSKVEDLADPSTFEQESHPSPQLDVQTPKVVVQHETNHSEPSARALPDLSKDSRLPSARPRLEQSSFSWMLEQDKSSTRPFNGASAFSQESNRSKDSLFGGKADDDDDDDAAVVKKRHGSGKQRKKSNDAGLREKYEEFDLSSLRHGRSKKGEE